MAEWPYHHPTSVGGNGKKSSFLKSPGLPFPKRDINGKSTRERTPTSTTEAGLNEYINATDQVAKNQEYN